MVHCGGSPGEVAAAGRAVMGGHVLSASVTVSLSLVPTFTLEARAWRRDNRKQGVRSV